MAGVSTSARLNEHCNGGPHLSSLARIQFWEGQGKFIISPAHPNEATMWFITVTDNREAIVSSEIIFAAKWVSGYTSGLHFERLYPQKPVVAEHSNITHSYSFIIDMGNPAAHAASSLLAAGGR